MKRGRKKHPSFQEIEKFIIDVISSEVERGYSVFGFKLKERRNHFRWKKNIWFENRKEYDWFNKLNGEYHIEYGKNTIFRELFYMQKRFSKKRLFGLLIKHMKDLSWKLYKIKPIKFQTEDVNAHLYEVMCRERARKRKRGPRKQKPKKRQKTERKPEEKPDRFQHFFEEEEEVLTEKQRDKKELKKLELKKPWTPKGYWDLPFLDTPKKPKSPSIFEMEDDDLDLREELDIKPRPQVVSEGEDLRKYGFLDSPEKEKPRSPAIFEFKRSFENENNNEIVIEIDLTDNEMEKERNVYSRDDSNVSKTELHEFGFMDTPTPDDDGPPKTIFD